MRRKAIIKLGLYIFFSIWIYYAIFLNKGMYLPLRSIHSLNRFLNLGEVKNLIHLSTLELLFIGISNRNPFGVRFSGNLVLGISSILFSGVGKIMS